MLCSLCAFHFIFHVSQAYIYYGQLLEHLQAMFFLSSHTANVKLF